MISNGPGNLYAVMVVANVWVVFHDKCNEWMYIIHCIVLKGNTKTSLNLLV